MEEAKRLLREDDVSVVNISKQVGYSNVSYFIKIFHENTGMTPAIYREETKNAVDAED